MAEPLKDHFDQELIDLLAGNFSKVAPGFDTAAFAAVLSSGFPARELKDRINLVADTLRHLLDDSYLRALDVVVEVAEAREIDGFSAWPLCSFVERHGIEHPEASLTAMERLTRQFSCEFAIRPFLDQHLELTLDCCRRWTTSDSPEVRRLPSEGTRPFLPWGPKVEALTADPEIGLSLLTRLRHDPDEVVRRSVANHLNDIARNHPDRVVEVATAWSAEAATDPAMIRHALRSLVKKGHPGALRVLGFTTEPRIEIEQFVVTPTEVSLGQSIELTTTIVSASAETQRLVVDFVVHHVNADGESSPKVFKWTTLDLAPDNTVTLTKKRRIATASTRKYHAGSHHIELQIAGRVQAATAFSLLEGSPSVHTDEQRSEP